MRMQGMTTVAAIAIVALGLAACGGDGDSTPKVDNTPTAADMAAKEKAEMEAREKARMEREAEAKRKAEMEAMMVEAERVAKAIGSEPMVADLDPDATGVQMPFEVTAGNISKTDMGEAFMSGDAPAMIDGMKGRTDVREDEDGMVTDVVVSYSNVGDASEGYTDLGYWLRSTTDEDDMVSYSASAFAHGKADTDYGDVMNVVGSATYTGSATGLYARKTFDTDGKSTPTGSGQFVADVELMVKFGGDDIALNDQFTVGGGISDFRDAMGMSIDGKWTVELSDGTMDKGTGMFSATTTGDGMLSGKFHGMDDESTEDMVEVPSSAVGTFDAHFTNGHVLGAFHVDGMADEKDK